MSVTITTIQPQDSLASSRITLNSNFSALKNGVDALQVFLDPTTAILTGIKSITVNDNAVPFSNSIFQVGKGSSLLGNVIMGTTGASTSVLVNGTGGITVDQSTITLNNGNIILSGASSLMSVSNANISKEVRLPGLATAFSSMIGLTSAYSVNVTDLKYVVISNAGITGPHVASLSSGNLGQVLEIFHQIGASGYPVWISATNFSGLTGSIVLTATADTLKCVYDGVAWYLMNYSPSSFATGGTTSSITFTTI
jgi:hypothetical protein